MIRFADINNADREAMAGSVEPLLLRATELVIKTYEYLRSVPETASILGWETGVDEAHLEERRRFFSIWVSRTLGMDTSEEFARYLFRAGQYHAGHGPRRIHTPADYVTGSIGLVLSAFARYMAEAQLPAELIATAMSGWSKYLTVQLNQMLMGYQVAREFEQGELAVHILVYGRLRPILGGKDFIVHTHRDSCASVLLAKFFNYYPQARAEALERVWSSEEKNDSLWVEVKPKYVALPGWRVLLNGRDLYYEGGFETPVKANDEIAIFPPGR
ncbi:MAG: protoglobin domain-containing protein [Anaerolineales bacterium]|nr:protoglobin domain-containing protein [Anaerolineales bacterium]